jgi:hypothetical protein
MFGFTKVVKLVGLFRRHPSDVMFLPVSVVFGYFHGLIKLYALATLNMVRPPSAWAEAPVTNLSRHRGVAEPMAIPMTSSAYALRHSPPSF